MECKRIHSSERNHYFRDGVLSPKDKYSYWKTMPKHNNNNNTTQKHPDMWHLECERNANHLLPIKLNTQFSTKKHLIVLQNSANSWQHLSSNWIPTEETEKSEEQSKANWIDEYKKCFYVFPNEFFPLKRFVHGLLALDSTEALLKCQKHDISAEICIKILNITNEFEEMTSSLPERTSPRNIELNFLISTFILGFLSGLLERFQF